MGIDARRHQRENVGPRLDTMRVTGLNLVMELSLWECMTPGILPKSVFQNMYSGKIWMLDINNLLSCTCLFWLEADFHKGPICDSYQGDGRLLKLGYGDCHTT